MFLASDNTGPAHPQVMEHVLAVTRAAGAEPRVHDLSQLRLPLMEQDASEQHGLPVLTFRDRGA